MESSTNHARIGKHDVPVVRLKLRAWLVLEEIYKKILDAAGSGKRDEFVSSMYSYISTALSVPVEELEQCFWAEIATAFILCFNANAPNSNLPLIKPIKEKKTFTTEILEYPGRSWYVWSNILASAYGWELDYIANLDVDDAVALYQEILIDDQLEKEWQWMLSENAYAYDEVSKKSKFVPLKRPDWMQPKVQMKDIPNVRIRKDEMPVGLVLRWEDDRNSKPQ